MKYFSRIMKIPGIQSQRRELTTRNSQLTALYYFSNITTQKTRYEYFKPIKHYQTNSNPIKQFQTRKPEIIIFTNNQHHEKTIFLYASPGLNAYGL